jgi:protein-L-isoaspartate(D-aspartate) O-methyltransferase
MPASFGLFAALAAFADSQNPSDADRFSAMREDMVSGQIAARGIKDPAVLRALRAVPRHEFVPAEHRREAYADHPLPIGEDQTISQPYIVALMSELARVRRGSRVLEIGTGSGYQAAVLAEMGAEVWTIEIIAPLGRRAAADLKRAGYGKVHTRIGDGHAGWPEAAPFDAVVITAAPPKVPQPLLDQLKPIGRLVVPEGEREQELVVYTKDAAGRVRRKFAEHVRFVPMTGKAQNRGS